MRRTHALAFLVVLVAGCTSAGSGGDAWLAESNPPDNHLFDSRQAREIRSFWYVSPSQIDVAAHLLEARAIVSISGERAAALIGRAPDVSASESLYLIRAIDVAEPATLRIYQSGTWVEASAATRSTCFMVRPPTRRQPIVVALPLAPTRLRLSYSCAG